MYFSAFFFNIRHTLKEKENPPTLHAQNNTQNNYKLIHHLYSNEFLQL